MKPVDDFQAAAELYIAVRTIRCQRPGCGHHIDAHAPEADGGCRSWNQLSPVGAVPDFEECDCPAFLSVAAGGAPEATP